MKRLLITPAAIRSLNPCKGRWQVYRAAHPADAAHPFVEILDCNGLDDTLWVLDRLPGPIALRLRRRAGAGFAERVLPVFERRRPKDKRPLLAIEAVRGWLTGATSEKELAAATAAAQASARGTVHAAARNAALAAEAAAQAAALAARAAATAAAWYTWCNWSPPVAVWSDAASAVWDDARVVEGMAQAQLFRAIIADDESAA